MYKWTECSSAEQHPWHQVFLFAWQESIDNVFCYFTVCTLIDWALTGEMNNIDSMFCWETLFPGLHMSATWHAPPIQTLLQKCMNIMAVGLFAEPTVNKRSITGASLEVLCPNSVASEPSLIQGGGSIALTYSGISRISSFWLGSGNLEAKSPPWALCHIP